MLVRGQEEVFVEALHGWSPNHMRGHIHRYTRSRTYLMDVGEGTRKIYLWKLYGIVAHGDLIL
jgi:hypothetical protein